MRGITTMISKKSKPKPDDKEQFARFIEAAGQVQPENGQKAFEDALEKIVKKKRIAQKTD